MKYSRDTIFSNSAHTLPNKNPLNHLLSPNAGHHPPDFQHLFSFHLPTPYPRPPSPRIDHSLSNSGHSQTPRSSRSPALLRRLRGAGFPSARSVNCSSSSKLARYLSRSSRDTYRTCSWSAPFRQLDFFTNSIVEPLEKIQIGLSRLSVIMLFP